MRAPILVHLLLYSVRSSGFSILEKLRDSSISKQVVTDSTSEEKGFRLPYNTERDVISSEYPMIDVSAASGHDFRPPTATDKRGPCPALNAMANHGYLPRDGIVSMLSMASSVYQVMDKSSLPSYAYATVICGNPISQCWSIGESKSGLFGLNILGGCGGLSSSHDQYESDASTFNYDKYQGDISTVRIEKFLHLLSQPANNYNLDEFIKHRIYTLNQSLAENPYFYWGPISGVLVSTAAHTFPSAMMSNWSNTYPDGFLSIDIISSFYAIYSDPDTGELYTKSGWNRIPQNWYRRKFGDEYGTTAFVRDATRVFAVVPPKIGGNTGKVNSFAGVDLGALTGGIFRTIDLQNPSSLACILGQLVISPIPESILQLLNPLLSLPAGCRAIQLNMSTLKELPRKNTEIDR